MTSCCTPEASAIVVLLVSTVAAIAGHWKLGVAVPVWDAAGMLRAYSVSQRACFDNRNVVAGETRLAVNVLARSAEQWHGQSQAALVHEALGHMRVRDGDVSGALKEIRKAARVAEFAVNEGALGRADAVPTDVLDSVRARVRVEEAKLLLLAGEYDSAIDAVGDSMNVENDARLRPARLRVQSLKVLITAAIRMSPSAEELEGIRHVFEKTKESIQDHADAATKAMVYDVTALLAEARKDLHETVDALDLAIAHCRQATNVGETLKRAKDRGAGDAAQAEQLAVLHSRMSEALRKRAASGDFAQAESHRLLAFKLAQHAIPDA